MSGRAATENVIPGQYALSVGDADMPCPPGWTWHLLTDIARLESGHTPSRNHPEWWGGSIPWIGIKDARPHHGKTIYETIECTNDGGLANSAARLLPAGTVCLSRTASVGYVVVMGKDMATSQDFVNWVCTEALVPDFLKYLFIAEKDALLRFSKGTTHSTIYFPEVKAFRVCLPPPPQQKRIVAKIEALQARSDAAKQALDAIPPLLEKLRQSILAAAFRGDLTRAWREAHPDVEPASVLLERIRAERRRKWEEANPKKKYVEPEAAHIDGPPEIPESWCWVSLDEVASGFDYGTAEKSDNEGLVPVLRMGNLQNGEIDWSDLKYTSNANEIEKYKLTAGTVLFNRTNSPELVGKTAIYRGERPAIFAGYLIRICLMDGVVPDFVNLNLNSRQGRDWCWRVKSDGVSQSNISAGKLKEYALPLCSKLEQEQLVSQARAQLAIVDRLREMLEHSETRHSQLTQSILAKAFRGELVPQDPNDEPASVLLERIRAERESTPAKPKPSKPRSTRTPKPKPSRSP